MLLKYNDEQIELERNNSAFNVIFEKVNELIGENDVVFSHLVVDNVEVYENHETYISERINDIIQIEIITHRTKEMIWETMESVRDYLQRAIPALQDLVDESYDDFSQETWEGISQLIEGMQWMLQFKEFTQNAPEQPKNWEKFAENFTACEEQFTPLLDAIETQDTVLITDILAYEITPTYEVLLDSIREMLQDTNFLKKIN